MKEETKIDRWKRQFMNKRGQSRVKSGKVKTQHVINKENIHVFNKIIDILEKIQDTQHLQEIRFKIIERKLTLLKQSDKAKK